MAHLTPFAGSPRPLTLLPITQIYILEDNQTADLTWTRSNPPIPTNPESSYRRVGCIADGNCLFHCILKSMASLYLITYQVPPEIQEATLSRLEEVVYHTVTFTEHIFDRPRNRFDMSTRYRIVDKQDYLSKMNDLRYEYARSLRGDTAEKILHDQKMQDIVSKSLPGSIELNAQTIATRELNITETGPALESIIRSHPGIIREAQNRVFRELSNDLMSGGNIKPDVLVLLSQYCNFDFYLLRDADLLDSSEKNLPLYGGAALHASVLGPQDMRPMSDPRRSLPNRNAIIIIAFNDMHYELIGRVDTNPSGERSLVLWFDQCEPFVRLLYMMLRDMRDKETKS